MAKTPDSNKSESWTARIPNDLATLAREKAISSGMVRDDGSANTTAILHSAIKTWLGLSDDLPNAVSQLLSNTVDNAVIQKLESQIVELANAMSDTVRRSEIDELKEAIARLEATELAKKPLSLVQKAA